jgi:hypothetical protein
VGIVAVAGVIGYLIWQSGQESSAQDEAARAAEADSSADIPGDWVDLVAIYGAPYGDTATHVQRNVDYPEDCATNDAGEEVCNSNPPVGGPHWAGGCGRDPDDSPSFCGPAVFGIYNEPWDPETLVHNMEHGGAVIWYNTEDEAIITELQEYLEPLLSDGRLLVMAPYTDMEADTIALTSWSRIDKFPVSEYTLDRVKTFVDANERRFNPENF